MPGAQHEKGVEGTKEQRSCHQFPPAISSIGVATSARSRFETLSSAGAVLWTNVQGSGAVGPRDRVVESSLKFRGGEGGRNSKGEGTWGREAI